MINKYIAPIINLVIAVPINFVMNKFWAYKQKKGDDNEPENQPA
jgi:putative flippase GtrA